MFITREQEDKKFMFEGLDKFNIMYNKFFKDLQLNNVDINYNHSKVILRYGENLIKLYKNININDKIKVLREFRTNNNISSKY